ncbi:hypothetical protein DFP74_3412 [Nocardiopsis sp. Huas11]|uniref:hypothetical protein n=1 Tax=Nocardiopsis sp. Huas11 TaxID=2183912 RepID=UPI000EB4A164|nr:hypothetical protein [Nocardiopsis sp. Huas11]RKS07728.1 hypothetical protein DFP74_3412 [Nocardiopsis sp. Huas11]
MRRNTREYDTELRVHGEVVTLDGVPYQGRTVLREGPDAFAPLERWAKGVAEVLGEPVTWRASLKGDLAARGTVQPGPGSQNLRAL